MVALARILNAAVLVACAATAPEVLQGQESPAPPAGSGASNAATPLHRYTFRQPSMGTLFELTLYAADQIDANRAAKAAFDRIRALDGALSDYNPDSELNALCATAGSGRTVAVSDDLWQVLEFSTAFSGETSGAFDVTVGPLVRLWRQARKAHVLPGTAALAEARERVGHAHVALEEGRRVTLRAPGMQIDLGGVAKGYALDAALRVLQQDHGIRRALIDGGGDVLAAEPPPGRSAWNVAVRNPADGGSPWIIPLANAALTTSGDLHQFLEIDGTRYSHIVDPVTGMGLTHRLQVSILAGSGMEADALASAVSVMGTTRGLDFVEKRPGCEALIVSGDKAGTSGGQKLASTGGFPLPAP